MASLFSGMRPESARCWAGILALWNMQGAYVITIFCFVTFLDISEAKKTW